MEISLVFFTGASCMRCLRISIVSVVLSVSPLKYFLPHFSFSFIRRNDVAQNNLRLHDFKRGLDEIWIIHAHWTTLQSVGVISVTSFSTLMRAVLE